MDNQENREETTPIRCLSRIDYEQLLGALGRLVLNEKPVPPAKELLETIKTMCREVDNDLCHTMHRKYRRECLNLGLVNVGYLFGKDDIDTLQEYLNE